MTFKEIVNKEKLRQGAWLLTHTSKSIQQIAQDVHCCDASHFGKLFQKVYRVSPSEYRENLCPETPKNREKWELSR